MRQDELIVRWCRRSKCLKLDLDVEMKKHGYPPILWNVLNYPQYIAEEFVNAYVKGNVKKQCKHNRTMPQLRKHILGGFYGDTDSNKRVHEPITPELCARWIAHCEMEIEKDARSMGLGNTLREIWTPDSEISVLREEEYCPFKQSWLDEMKGKFEVLM